MSFKSFEELDCWKLATELRRDLIQLVKTFPAHEKFELVGQIRRASRSVTHNIAEGFGRYHYQDSIRFYIFSRGSLSEILDHLIIANDEGCMDDESLKTYRLKIQRCTAVLNGFINHTARMKSNVAEPAEEYAITDNEESQSWITNNELRITDNG